MVALFADHGLHYHFIYEGFGHWLNEVEKYLPFFIYLNLFFIFSDYFFIIENLNILILMIVIYIFIYICCDIRGS